MAQLQTIRLQNYKSLREIELDVSGLNILIGRNGSGKSNLLSFFRLMKRAVNEQLKQSINQMGGINEIRWKGAASHEPVEWHLAFHDLQEASRIHYEGDIQSRGNNSFVSREELAYPPKEGHESGFRLLGTYNGVIRNLYPKQTIDEKHIDEDSEPSAPNVDSDYDNTELALAQVRDPIHYPLFSEVREAINDWTIFRGFGEKAIDHIYEAQMLDVVSPLRLDPTGQNLVSVLHTLVNQHLDTRDELYSILSQAFPDFKALLFPVPASGKAEIQWATHNSWTFPARSMSDGMLRFLGLATLLLLPNPPSLIAIDEPEIGLHPKLLPLLAGLLKKASAHTQVIVTTHSPQLLNAEDIEPDDVLVVEKEDGATAFQRLSKDDLRLWLRRYTLGNLWTMGKLEQY
jgi:predicted ATPase